MEFNWNDITQRGSKNGAQSAPKAAPVKATAPKNALCIAVDTRQREIDFYSMENSDRSTLAQGKKGYAAKLYSAEFMTELTEAVRDYAAAHPAAKDSGVFLLVPDEVVCMDTVSLPNMNRRRNASAVDATISGLYKNRDELLIHEYLATQNKNLAMYSLTVLNQGLVQALKTAVTDGGLATPVVSFASNAAINAASQLSPKMKNASYILLDIQPEFARVVFAAKGRTTGFYNLPFGYTILQKNKVASEDMLFDHSVAELAVLNARERAKAKQLTIMRKDATAEETEDGAPAEKDPDEIFGDDEQATADPTASTAAVTIKTLPRKTPRKLPKYMLRPLPKDDEECSYENFRIFMKWVLTIKEANTRLITQGAPEAVYVNLPEELHFLFSMVNEEEKENGIEFRPLELPDRKSGIGDNLALYGGLYLWQYNQNNNF